MGVSFIFILAMLSFSSLSVWYVCVCVWVCVCVCSAYSTISISILYVSCEEISLTESNEQICYCYKTIVFEKQIHCVFILESKFLVSANYTSSVIQTDAIMST